MPAWPNIEKLAVAHLAGVARTVTRVPSDIEGAVPLIRVTRGPGSDDGITDAPLLDVETFTASQGSAVDRWDLAEAAREAVHALAGRSVGGMLVDSVSTSTGPVSLDYGNPNVDRYVASYRLAFRKQ